MHVDSTQHHSDETALDVVGEGVALLVVVLPPQGTIRRYSAMHCIPIWWVLDRWIHSGGGRRRREADFWVRIRLTVVELIVRKRVTEAHNASVRRCRYRHGC